TEELAQGLERFRCERRTKEKCPKRGTLRTHRQERLSEACNTLEFRAEGLAPLTHHMGFVNRECPKPALASCIEERTSKGSNGGLCRNEDDWKTPVPDSIANSVLRL